MLDSQASINQYDPDHALDVAADQYEGARYDASIENISADIPPISRVIVTGMGGSALAALLAQTWLRDEPFTLEVTRDYTVPTPLDDTTLVIASSYSGNTEETLSSLRDAQEKGALCAVITSGGQLEEIARNEKLPLAVLPAGYQPRMTTVLGLRTLTALLVAFKLLEPSKLDEIAATHDFLKDASRQWQADIPTKDNLAKRLAEQSAGKTAVMYGGSLSAPLAYKWKISWNENAKNVAFWNQYPEFNHNEFMGWASHPVDKPFAVFDLLSSHEHPQVLKRFEISDTLLSGLRPKATQVVLAGDSLLEQLLWGAILADFSSIYLALLNGVNPTPVHLIEKLKKEL